jgi:hypothetical protein
MAVEIQGSINVEFVEESAGHGYARRAGGSRENSDNANSRSAIRRRDNEFIEYSSPAISIFAGTTRALRVDEIVLFDEKMPQSVP